VSSSEPSAVENTRPLARTYVGAEAKYGVPPMEREKAPEMGESATPTGSAGGGPPGKARRRARRAAAADARRKSAVERRKSSIRN